MNAEAMHASAPTGCGCADCAIDGEACPTCYAAWWRLRHPNHVQVGGEFTIPRVADKRDVLDVIHKWSDTKPEPEEDWESWFVAAFDLMANEIATLFEGTHHFLSDATRVADHLEDGGKGWQPIETAPKDGSNIILGFARSHAGEGYWMGKPERNHWGESGWFECTDDVLCDHPSQPTHWMPLPEAPADPQRTAIGMRREGQS